jgi:hypothetical protein
MKLSKLMLVATLALTPSLALAQDSSSTTPPAASSSTASAPVAALPVPAAPSSPLANLNLQSALNAVDTDILFLVNDIKENTKFTGNSIMATQGFDVAHGQWLTGVGLPFVNIGSYDYFAAELDRQTTTGGGTTSKPIPLLANEVRLNAVTTPIVKWGLSRIPVLNNNQQLVGNLANALSVGVAAGHDFNSDINQRVILNRVVVDMNFTYKFGGVSSIPAPAASSSTSSN